MYDVINISKILDNDDIHIKMLKKSLILNGWCFVKFGDYFNEKTIFHAENIKKFFNKTNKEKNNYSYEYNIGYYQNDFKQHFKILTGDYSLPKVSGYEKDASLKSMVFISVLMDKLMQKILLNMKTKIFNLKDIDMECLSVNNTETIGLLDFVEYKKNTQREYFVGEHVDPGLFSLNIYSNQKGMEFYDYQEKKWIEMPLGYGAIFCGQAAKTLCNFPPAKHRVKNHNAERLSIWYEIGIKSQIPNKNLIVKKNKIEKIYDITKMPLFFVENTKRDLYKVVVEDINNFVNIYLDASAKPKVIDLKREIENSSMGLPVSKVMHVETMKIEKKHMDNVKEIHKKLNLTKFNDDKFLGQNKDWILSSQGYLTPGIKFF
jgi:isopenicillin N synthase-like dioxygenase